MPTSARKSSLGASRRVQQRAHLPFRADDLGRGKRTGLPVPTIEHKSDDFEPFDEILSHADTRTAWHGQNKPRPGSSKKRKSVAPIYEDDDGGEMSMELDDNSVTINSGANAYFSNARQPSSPLLNRAGPSSRPMGRSSIVDFDAVPSPRPRKSLASGMRRASIGSPLRSPRAPPDIGIYPSIDDGGGGVLSESDADIEEPEPPSKRSRYQKTPRRASFSIISQDSDGENLPSPRSKGKREVTRKNQREEGDDEVEKEIAQGLDDIEMDQVEEITEPPPKKKPAEKRPPKRAMPAMPSSPENTTGLRRGKRLRYEPLEWWRCEKVVYGRRDQGKVSYVPTIKEIVRIPKDTPKSLGAAHKNKRSTAPRSKTEEVITDFNPEEGWDDKTPTNGVVIDWFTGNEVSRRLAYPGRLVNHRSAANNDFFFTKVFGDGEYIAAGQLRIPPNKHKPSKMTKDNTYVFYVIEGAVTFKVHESSYVLCSGGMILVPRGNTYYIENIAERDAKLFFAQARRVSAEEEAPPEVLPAPDPETPATPQRRSNSVSQAPVTTRLSSERAAPSKRGVSTRA
ncbi:Mif2/CENP-C like-domain-containing protein [Multifurca ochricompacta]|uniref:CENP-C homolog n=1 Tax=Multifurca ochricompacta TaxID=376703 RepID=A0AAD4MCN4_9AGAM|nr:Mif2/CENP-C like-domain-containing protein [Multifurca ochricompacta]